MGWVSPEQIERAKQVDIVDYLRMYEPGNIRHDGGSRYTLREHDSFVISNGKWYWNSRDIGCSSGTALNYLICVRGYRFTDAVLALAGGASRQQSHVSEKKSPVSVDRKPFILPPRNGDSRRVTAYLQSRGIDKGLIADCIENGLIYESAGEYRNCVFTGKNSEGKIRFACMRSTTARYHRDVDGSDKRYGFLLPPENADNSNAACFEAPIDALSHKTMCIIGAEDWDGWRLALSGGSLHALKHFLATHKQISSVYVCTDMDAAGQKTAERIYALASDRQYRHISIKPYPPPCGNDWNDALQALLKERRLQRQHGNPGKEMKEID